MKVLQPLRACVSLLRAEAAIEGISCRSLIWTDGERALQHLRRVSEITTADERGMNRNCSKLFDPKTSKALSHSRLPFL